MTPSDILENRWVRLEPLSRDHIKGLDEAGIVDAIWTYMPRQSANTALEDIVDRFISDEDPEVFQCFCILRPETGMVLGTVALENMSRPHRRAEVGQFWIRKKAQGTQTFPATLLALLDHIFDQGILRLELRCDSKHGRTAAAYDKIGAIKEGELRSYERMMDGSRRTTAIYSILKQDWSEVRSRLTAELVK